MDSWRFDAACAGLPNAWFFPDEHDKGRGAYMLARPICAACPARHACLHDAMDYERGAARDQRHGMFGGLTPRERYDLARGKKVAA